MYTVIAVEMELSLRDRGCSVLTVHQRAWCNSVLTVHQRAQCNSVLTVHQRAQCNSVLTKNRKAWDMFSTYNYNNVFYWN